MEDKLRFCYSYGCANRFLPGGGTFEERELCPGCRAQSQESRPNRPQQTQRLIKRHTSNPDGYRR